MKTVVITGSAQGFGFEMAKVFRTHGFNVVLSDINKEMLKIAHSELLKIESSANVENTICDVTSYNALTELWNLDMTNKAIAGWR